MMYTYIILCKIAAVIGILTVVGSMIFKRKLPRHAAAVLISGGAVIAFVSLCIGLCLSFSAV